MLDVLWDQRYEKMKGGMMITRDVKSVEFLYNSSVLGPGQLT
jgi:hypothetical protein